MERRAQAAESLVARSSGQAALDYAIQAADLYMRAASEASSKQDATRLRRKCRQLITAAESFKATLNASSSPSQSLLHRVSKLHGNTFSPWTAEPRQDEFELKPGEMPFIDDALLTLSPRQTATFNGWKRPQELFRSQLDAGDDVLMEARHSCDLVQDLTTDCSVVASLCAAMRILTGKQSVLSNILYPFDHTKNMPALSPSGKYILRMHFNGCPRRVVIDDRLPDSLTDRTLFVIDRQNPILIWPALLEKAYLKVRGGYDFPGSNSGTDLWVLTGWIPDQIFLQREDLDIDSIWKRITTAHEMDNIVVTLGTGRISTEEEELLGLIGEHDYAVMDLDATGDTRRLLIKNPWCNGPVWKGTIYTPKEPVNLPSSQEDITAASNGKIAGSFWMSLDDVIQHFESMYLNWNPALFSHRQSHHLSWHIPAAHSSSSLVKNPQFSLQCPNGGSVWILASRHFMDAELELARTKTDSMAAVSRQLGFMSILIFDNGGKRVEINDGEIYRGPYVDSPQTLARLDAVPGKHYTVVLDQHEFPFSAYTLTLDVFSHNPAEVEEAKDAMPHAQEITGAWNRRTAGGNAACSTFFRNPQYKLKLSRSGPITILLATDRQDVHVHVDLVWGGGKRVDAVKVRDLVGSSGEYRRGCAIATLPHVDAGDYTLVCSTFEADQLADFNLRVSSTSPTTLEPVLGDAAGKLRTRLPVFKLVEGEEMRRAPLTSSFLNRVSINARSIAQSGSERWSCPPSTLTMRLSVVHRWAPERTLMAMSGDGEFQEPKTVVRTPEFDMEPGRVQREGMWLVVENMGTHNTTDGIEIELYSDSPVRVGPWELVQDP